VLTIYGALTVAGFAGLWAASGQPFLSLVHALAATATGGYSTFEEGAAGFGAVGPQGVIAALCVLGALSLDLHGRLHRGRWRAIAADPGARALLGAIALVAILVASSEGARDAPGAWKALRLAIMAQTTAGFTTDPLESLAPASQAVLALSMLAGRSSRARSTGAERATSRCRRILGPSSPTGRGSISRSIPTPSFVAETRSFSSPTTGVSTRFAPPSRTTIIRDGVVAVRSGC